MSVRTGEQRVRVYIDGLNLYHGLRAAYGARYKWLNMEALSESFLRAGMRLARVRYFTSLVRGDEEARVRQGLYLKALEAHCPRLEIITGKFQKQVSRCFDCGRLHVGYGEKKTDVNIASAMLHDTCRDLYDCCYLVSGDSDLAPPLQLIREEYPDKRTIVASPPKRKSRELQTLATGSISVTRKQLRDSQLPNQVPSRHGGLLERPEAWQ